MITSPNRAKMDVLGDENERGSSDNKIVKNSPRYSHVSVISQTIKTQAEKIIDMFGNARKLADALRAVGYQINRSSVYRWTYSYEKGGTGGIIPTLTWPYIIKAARIEGIFIPSEMMNNPRETQEIKKRHIAKIDNRTGERIPWVHWAEKKAAAKKIRAEEARKNSKKNRKK